MADILIDHLKKKSGEHGALKTLASQWDFDAKLIPKALQAVGNLFPHYSRHDESHSRQILVNIERLLGESVSLLTATDTWLILEAAYWHDIGMVVPKQDLSEELQSEEFQDFLASLRQSPQHDLFRFASTFDPSDLAKCFLGADTPTDAVARFNELMAEWFRRKHPARAEAMVRAPWSSAGISSPRTELMPARLFRVLGRICQMHGTSFEALLSADGLPFKEAGMANEDCHPRFVACLLRMGDLLDLDDNRFCPVLQRIAGDDRPATSRAHEDKHQAIRHLRIDRDRIEVSAECQTIPGYLEAFRWFDWLKQETQNQMAHWQEIAPSRELGLLPTLGNLTVTLSGDLQVLQEGRRPQFGIDEKNVIGLLQGSNLYNSAFPCIRELLQNAVDATLLGIWAKESRSALSGEWASPAACGRLQTASPVKVELIESDDPAGEAGKATWFLRITDGGTGISSADLLHMLRIGGSQKNAARQRLIRAMPEWMKPSGAFGIGLQSAFLLSDCIRLKTKSVFSNETLELEMHSPLGPNEGLVVVRRVPNDVAQAYGTALEMKLRLHRFAQSWQIPAFRRDHDSVAAQLVMSMDPLLDDTFPYDAGKMVDEVVAFGKKSPIRVACEFAPLAGEKKSFLADSLAAPEEAGDWRFLPDANGHCVEFRYRPHRDQSASHQSRFLYRGQPFKCNAAYFPNVWFEINLLSGAAGTWLSANRDELAPKAADEIEAVALSALTQAVEADMTRYREESAARPEYWADLSLFLHVMALSEGEPWRGLAAQTGGAWKDVSVIGQSIRTCFDLSDWLLGTGADATSGPVEHCDVSTGSPSGDAVPTLALLAWEREKNGSVQILAVDELNPASASAAGHLGTPAGVEHTMRETRRMNPVLRFSLDPQPYYSDAAFALHLISNARSIGNHRCLVAIRDARWLRLALRKDFQLPATWLIRPCASSPTAMLLPYLFTSGEVQVTPSQLMRLCVRMQPLLAVELTIDEVRHLYEDLITYIDDDLMAASAYAARWRAARSGDGHRV
ncbi:hypothetical protein [Rhodanobacter terrae]|uniref:HD-CE domain-containing protein n=1 Tax=Rhodanobacter terrae TaxID=418647 RepID=A0ABW0T316_9GAMM